MAELFQQNYSTGIFPTNLFCQIAGKFKLAEFFKQIKHSGIFPMKFDLPVFFLRCNTLLLQLEIIYFQILRQNSGKLNFRGFLRNNSSEFSDNLMEKI